MVHDSLFSSLHSPFSFSTSPATHCVPPISVICSILTELGNRVYASFGGHIEPITDGAYPSRYKYIAAPPCEHLQRVMGNESEDKLIHSDAQAF